MMIVIRYVGMTIIIPLDPDVRLACSSSRLLGTDWSHQGNHKLADSDSDRPQGAWGRTRTVQDRLWRMRTGVTTWTIAVPGSRIIPSTPRGGLFEVVLCLRA